MAWADVVERGDREECDGRTRRGRDRGDASFDGSRRYARAFLIEAKHASARVTAWRQAGTATVLLG